ncbi:2-C-methyl-D-erythritol 2,4-cyclodiphosphate synthase [Chlamydiota bacterium]
MNTMKIGFGYDIHRLVPDRELVLGGVTIPFEKGLLGHSDADVLIHAICDGLLGAMGKRDIGMHFSDTDEHYKNISSTILLSEVKKMMDTDRYCLINLDTVLILENPRIAEFIPEMQKIVSQFLQTSSHNISIKATTHEGVGDIGRGEAIASYAIVLIDQQRN